MPAPPPSDRLPPSYDPGQSAAPAPDGSVAWEAGSATSSASSSIPPEQPGRYRSVDSGDGRIGQGGIGIVYAVWDEVLGREVACKVLAAGAGQAQAAERFLREARATARLQHPGIVPVYDLGRRPDGAPYYTMKYVRGRTLAAAIAERATLEERLGLLGAFVDACQAIAYAHSEGVLHRDLKPANVMVGEFGETVVLDWGLARVGAEPQPTPGDAGGSLAAAPHLTSAGAILGTPAYMSPEQAAGAAADERADVWSLGAILYEILAGRAPFAGSDVAEVLRAVREGAPPALPDVCPGVPSELVSVVSKALTRAPEQRYARAADLAADVEAWRSGLRVSVYPYSLTELIRRFIQRHRLAFAVASAALLALGGLGATSYERVLAERNRARSAEAVALRREGEAVSNLADALAQQAVSTPELDRFTAELYAAGSLAMGERPEARGVLARVRSGWAPTLEARFSMSDTCATIAWLGEDLLCLNGQDLTVWRPDRSRRFALRLDSLPSRSLLEISPDGARLAVALQGGVALVVDAASGAIQRRIPRPGATVVTSLAFSPDGRLLYVGAADRLVGIGVEAWDIDSGARVGASAGDLFADDLATRPDGTVWMGSRANDRFPGMGVVQLDPRTLRELRYLPVAKSVPSIGWSPDGRWLSAAAGDGTTLLWDGEDLGAGPRTLGSRGGLGVTRWSPDGRLLVDLREDGRVVFWQADTWAPRFGMSVLATSWRALAFTPDSQSFATMSGRTVTRWRLGELPAPGALDDGRVPAVGAAFLPDGRLLTGRPGEIAVWGPDGAPLARLQREEGLSFGTAESVFGGGRDGLLRLDLASGDVLGRYESGPTRAAVVVDAGRRVVTLGDDGSLAGWTLDGRALWRRDASEQHGYLFGGDEPIALSLSYGDRVAVIDAETGEPRLLSDAPGCYYGGLSRNGRWAALTWRGGDVTVYDTRSAAEIARFQPYAGVNPRVAVSDDGRLVAAAGADRAIRVWDLARQALIAVLRGHEERIQSLAFSPDGLLLVSTDWSERARRWLLTDLRTPGEELLRRAEARSNLRLEGVRVVPAPL